MTRRVCGIGKDERGSSLAEFALIFPVFALMTFGVLEAGYLMWQFQQGAIAAKRAVRIATTRDLITSGAIPDCGPNTPSGTSAGTLCSVVADYTSWLTCEGKVSDPAGCGTDVADVIAEINNFYPRSGQGTASVKIELSGAGLGFQGLGRPVPMVTVRFEGVQFDFIVLQAFGIGPVSMPEFEASAPAEDLTNGP